MELEGNGYSYYVEHTTKTKKNILKDHHRGERALTRYNKPLKIIYWENIGLTLEHEAHQYSEEKIIELMEKYGIEEVRGSTRFCHVDLNKHLLDVIFAIRRMTTPTANKLQVQMKRYSELYRELFDPLSLYYIGKKFYVLPSQYREGNYF